MESIKRAFLAVRRDPVYTIGVILAVGLIIFACYFIGPWYTGGPTASIAATFDTQIARVILGLAYIVPAASFLAGLTKRNHAMMRWGMFGIAIGCTFITILRLVTFGAVPFVWLFMLICALISGVVYLYISLNGEQ